jgi:transposase InsO family protein
MNIYPNAYYNYRKHRKAARQSRKKKVLEKIQFIYHEHGGVDGYRQMRAYLKRQGIDLSALTVHKYMNTELGLRSVVRPKRPEYRKGKAHKIFPNLLNQDFSSSKINVKWCTDFTYLHLADGSKRYNCIIIDLHDRSVVASITDKSITADLGIRTLRKAIELQHPAKGLILHSDQGSQYTSKEFIEYCESVGVIQSMSKAGCPYDNAPMERYFNTLKNEFIDEHSYKTEKQLYGAIDEFAYVTYNHRRPHSYNGYKTPFEARYAS